MSFIFNHNLLVFLYSMSRSRSSSATPSPPLDLHSNRGKVKPQEFSRRKRRYSSGSSKSGGADHQFHSHSRSRDPKRSKSKSKLRSPYRKQQRSGSQNSRSRSGSSLWGRDVDYQSEEVTKWSFDDHNSEDGYRLHVADLDSKAVKRDLEKLFGRYGPMKEIWMAQCFAFVVFQYQEDAEEAQHKTDGAEVCGRRVRVTVARPRTNVRKRNLHK